MSTLDLTARWLAVALRPLATAASGTESDGILFVERLGFTLPSIPPAWRALGASADAMQDAFASVLEAWQLRAASEADDAGFDEAGLALAASLAGFVHDIDALPDGLAAQLPADYLAATGIAGAIRARLFDTLFDRFLTEQFPLARNVLTLLGVIERIEQPADPDRSQPAFTQVTVHWARLALAVTDPQQLFRDVYGWGTPALDAARLFDALLPLTYLLVVPGEIHYPSIAFLEAMAPELGPVSHAMIEPELWTPIVQTDDTGAFLVLTPLPVAPVRPQGIAASLVLRGGLAETIRWSPWVTFELAGAATVGTGLAAVFQPDRPARVVVDAAGSGGGLTGRVAATVRIARPADRPPVLAVSDGSRLDVGEVALSVTATGGPAPDVAFELALSKSTLTVSAGDKDGLLSQILPAAGLAATFDARLVWSTRDGVHFAGGAGLAVGVPLTVSAGPIRLTQLDLVLAPTAGGVAVGLLVSGDLSIGPVVLGLQRLGVNGVLGFHDGNLGSADFAIEFAPPQGAAIAVSAGPVSGGGMFGRGLTDGRYSGALALEILGLQVDAYGVLDTRPPGGGYSLAVVMSAIFPAIQIGLGFALSGIGGLIALHRSVDTDALRGSLRNGGLDNIFFPDDPVARAAGLVTQLATYFPATRGVHVLGPAVKLGWGNPQLVQAKLALLLEIPSLRVIVLGDIQLGLPTLDKRLVDLRLDVLGVLDLQRGTLALDASLHDSKLAGYALTGDMALRLGWGDAPQFLLSIGGFHPHFTPPPGFPALRRLTLTAGDNPQLRLSAYLALTSNTAQVGAQADLTAHGGGFEIKAHVGFDALFDFVPFHFEVEIAASAAISWHGHHLLGVDLDFLLSGLHPWHAKGDAAFGVLWWDVSVGFDTTWGDATPAPLPPPPPIAGALTEALGRAEAWSSELAAGEPPWVTLGPSAGPTSTIVVHPFAALVVRERAVPLGYRITQFGNIPLAAPQQFDITGVRAGTSLLGTTTVTPVTDAFAPGQFTRLTTDQRLASPSFERFPSGVRIASDEVRFGASARSTMDLDTEVVDPLAPPAPPPRVVFPTAIAVVGPAVRPTRTPAPSPRTGPRLADLAFVLASLDDLSITAEGAAIAAGSGTYAALRESLRARVAATGRVPRLQIVPRVQVSNHSAHVVVVREDDHMRNVDFVDTLTGRAMTRAEFVDAIHAGQYPDYYVRNIHGVPTPVSRPNTTTSDNLG